MKILLNGGDGYIGSHIYLELIRQNYNPIIFDNFSNSKISIVKKLNKITKKPISYISGSLLDTQLLIDTINKYKITNVIHLAGSKSVKESVINPIEYFSNNVSGSISLLRAMELSGCKNIIFSSSATVYGFPNKLPISEKHTTIPINPYGTSKLMIEKIIIDLIKSNKLSKAVILRYFNPIGCHPSGLICDQPIGIPNNIMPILSQVVLNKDKPFKIFGSDYKTKDGTGVRDYIHVLDLAEGHLLALSKMKELEPVSIFNLGTGKGYSVLEIIETFSSVANFSIPFEFHDRRDGDLDEIYADPSLANRVLNFSPQYSLENMCKSTWNYIKNIAINNEH